MNPEDDELTILDRLDPEIKNRIVAESEAASVPLVGSGISSVWLKGKGVSVHIVPKKAAHDATGAPLGRPYRVAFLDIETAPNRGYTWGKYEQNVIEFDQEWYLLCFGVKWSGEDTKTQVYAQPDFDGYDGDRTSDVALTAKLWEVLDQADLVIAHNGDKFDLRKSNARFLAAGMTPPSPYKTVDTLKIARRHFALNSNKLDDIARILGLGRKAETGGFQLWLDCMAGDRKAWKKMKNYCGHDVDLLEAVYNRMRPWHATHPNIATGESELCCAGCGSDQLQRRGTGFTGGRQIQRYQCFGCGKWSSGEVA